MTASRTAWTVLACVITLVACAPLALDEPDRKRGPALLLFYGDTSTVTLPATGRVGVPFVLTVTSFGGGCITQGGTEFTVRGLEAEVRPYRNEIVRLPPNTVCTGELRIFRDTVSLEFTQPGEARVRIRGLGRPGDTPFTIERSLSVVP